MHSPSDKRDLKDRMSIISILNNEEDEQDNCAPARLSIQLSIPITGHNHQVSFVEGSCINERQRQLGEDSPDLVVAPMSRLTVNTTPHRRFQDSRRVSSHARTRRRAARPKYDEERTLFVWYNRTDLGRPWPRVLCEYRQEFRECRNKPGLQCKFYRTLSEWNVEKVRAQKRTSRDLPGDCVGRYGVIQRTNRRYRWMKPEHRDVRCLPQFTGNKPGSRKR